MSRSAALARSTALTSRPSLRRLLQALVQVTAVWSDRHRTRHALSRLDAHMLDDIGLGPRTRAAECKKPFWAE
jgi:uncharacterized protein YjiS (DUF1127 family)